MGNGIMMCGLNGSGKSTLGKALAERLGYYFIDNERLFFPKTDGRYLFASRTGSGRRPVCSANGLQRGNQYDFG